MGEKSNGVVLANTIYVTPLGDPVAADDPVYLSICLLEIPFPAITMPR